MGHRKLLVKLSVPLAAVLLTLLALEAAVRVYRIARRADLPPAASEGPPEPLHVVTEGPHLYELNSRHSDISEQGTRDEEVAVPKPEGVFRVLVLGDSLAYGAAVGRERTFPERLEALLREKYPRAEVVNAGVSGYTAYNELQYYLARGREFEADVVLLAFCLNDAVNPRLHWGDAPGVRFPAEAIPNQTYDREHVLPKMRAASERARRRAPRPSAWRRLLDRSELYRAVAPGVAGLFRRGDEGLAHTPGGVPVYLTAEDEISIETLTGDTPEWRWLTDIYGRLDGAVRADGARLFVALFPLAYQLDEGYPFFPQRRLAEFCERRGVPALDLLPALARGGKARVFMLNNSGYYDVWHLSEEGHALAAKELLRALSARGLLPATE
ncbi:MAG TPA: SGNH/GDSL hydrolase family protein [Pyrinomonadaceae bacterium]|nr:SGNH/GDSL hydrolase family protein [Pyrinomonadaceae bacterium]